MKENSALKPQGNGKLCKGHNRQGAPCQKYAVNGWEVCRNHGANGGRPPTNPKTLLKNALNARELREKTDELIESGFDVLDLTRVAATLHVLADEAAEKRGDDGASLQLLFTCLDLLRKTVQSVEHIRASKAFTKAEQDYIVLRLVQFVETLPESERPGAIAFIEGLATPQPMPPGKALTH